MKRLALLLWPLLAFGQQGNNPQQSYLQLLIRAKASGQQFEWPGGIGVFMCSGTWNGATVSLQFVGPDGVTLITAGTATTLTANGGGVFYLPADNIQATVTSPGASTSITCSAGSVPSPPSA
jgi:hypothetical protein